MKGIENPNVINTINIRIRSLLKYSEIISEGVTNPYFFDSIHIFFEKITLTNAIAITDNPVIEKGKPLRKIRLG